MKNMFSALSLARGFTVLFMPAIHIVMLCSQPSIYQRWWVYALRFIAEGPGAQLFMFIMGFLLALGKPKTAKQIIDRSIRLFLSGYLLNICRIYLPAFLGLWPSEAIQYYQTGNWTAPQLSLILTGDILQFAGIAYGFIGLVGKLPNKVLLLFVSYSVVAALGPFIWGLKVSNPIIDHLLALVCANDQRAFFPLFPWLCYPIGGWLCAHLGESRLTRGSYEWLGTYGLVLMVIGISLESLFPTIVVGDFYRSSPGRTIANTGFVMIWLLGFQYLTRYLSANHLLYKILNFCSQRINAVYWFHWILVGWSLGILGYHHLNEWQSWVTMCWISVISFSVPFLFFRYKAFLFHHSEN